MTLAGKVKMIRIAGSKHNCLKIIYKDLKGFRKLRIVEPYSWKVRGSSLLLYAHCRERDQIRLFALSRVVGMEVSRQKFLPKHDMKLGMIPGSNL